MGFAERHFHLGEVVFFKPAAVQTGCERVVDVVDIPGQGSNLTSVTASDPSCDRRRPSPGCRLPATASRPGRGGVPPLVFAGVAILERIAADIDELARPRA